MKGLDAFRATRATIKQRYEAQRELMLPKPKDSEHVHVWHKYKSLLPFHPDSRRHDKSDYLVYRECEGCDEKQKLNIVRV